MLMIMFGFMVPFVYEALVFWAASGILVVWVVLMMVVSLVTEWGRVIFLGVMWHSEVLAEQRVCARASLLRVLNLRVVRWFVMALEVIVEAILLARYLGDGCYGLL